MMLTTRLLQNLVFIWERFSMKTINVLKEVIGKLNNLSTLYEGDMEVTHEHLFSIVNQCAKDLNSLLTEMTTPNAGNRVNHPSHYTWLKELCGIEVIDLTRHMDFCLGNAIKYILRCGHKTEQGLEDKEKAVEDLQKAVWYIRDKIKSLEEK